MRQSSVELVVGIFVLLGIICLGYLTFRLGEVEVLGSKYYFLNARFTSVTGLKVGAQVELAGVQVGQVDAIVLDPKELVALVRLGFSPDRMAREWPQALCCNTEGA